MMFQLQYQYGGGRLQQIFSQLQDWGLIDFLLPFLLIFTLMFSVLQKVKIFSKPKLGPNGPEMTTDNPPRPILLGDRRLNGTLALAVSVLVVVPHVIGYYPRERDPVLLIMSFLPTSAVMLGVVLLALLIVGFVSAEAESPAIILPGVLGAGVVLLVFLQNFFPNLIPSSFFIDPTTMALAVVLVVFVGVVYLVTREEKKSEWEKTLHKYFGQKVT
ncbi:hypothetical protein HY489_01130 [Candidatus Woesearchaeota archaeon]|nr:hypothetical protein [Candidatus Woesearchaeota archaeon]